MFVQRAEMAGKLERETSRRHENEATMKLAEAASSAECLIQTASFQLGASPATVLWHVLLDRFGSLGSCVSETFTGSGGVKF